MTLGTVLSYDCGPHFPKLIGTVVGECVMDDEKCVRLRLPWTGWLIETPIEGATVLRDGTGGRMKSKRGRKKGGGRCK